MSGWADTRGWLTGASSGIGAALLKRSGLRRRLQEQGGAANAHAK